MCMIDGAESGGFSVSVDRRARKQHRCVECFRLIEPGETYEYTRGFFEGHFWISKTCAHCQAARSWLVKECNGWVYGGVGEDLGEHVAEGYRDPWLLGYVAGMRRQWKGCAVPPRCPGRDVLELFHIGPLSPFEVDLDDDENHDGLPAWPAELMSEWLPAQALADARHLDRPDGHRGRGVTARRTVHPRVQLRSQVSAFCSRLRRPGHRSPSQARFSSHSHDRPQYPKTRRTS